MDATAAKVRLDSDGYIGEDVFCTDCGYNLRGIHPGSACPECGTPAANAFDTLQFSDPAWIARLASGLHWIMFTLIWSVVFSLFTGLLQALAFGGSGLASHITSVLIVMIPTLTYLWGIWKFTTPPPVGGPADPSITRGIARYGTLAAAILTLISSFSPSPNLLSIGPNFEFQPLPDYFVFLSVVAGLGMTASMLIGTIAMIAAGLYARRLAFRIPDKKLGRNIAIVMWGSLGVVLLLLLMIGLAIAALVITDQQTSAAFAIAMILPGCGSVIGVLVFGTWSLIILSKYRNKLRQVAERAALRKVGTGN